MRDMISDENAISEVFGFILLLSIAITAIGIILLMSWPALMQSQDQAQQQNMEQAFTLLDSHTSKAQYSNYLSQTTDMKLNGGRVYVSSSDSWIRIMINETEVYSGTLGTIHYDLNGLNIGYQDGGIWKSDGKGGSVMISAPDFNYKHETLTLPLMQITGDSSVSGTGEVSITTRSNLTPKIVFPNGTINYMGAVNLTNPIKANQIYVFITSDYYLAWADYINSRTSCAVRPGDIYPANKTIKITFNTKPSTGIHPFTPPIWFRGINLNNQTPIEEFYFNLTEVYSDSQIDLKSPQSNAPGPYPALHISFQKSTGAGPSGIRIVVNYYLNSSVTETFEATKLHYIYPNDTCNIDLLNSSIETEYTSNSKSVTWGTNNESFDTGDFDKTVAGLKVGPSMDKVIQHYMINMTQNYINGFALWMGNNGGQHWPGVSSSYTLDYDAENVVTYMHITNNDIAVSI
jgi:hypothetical protein